MVKYPNARALKSSLAKKEIKPLYLFLGEEEGEKDNYINEIKSILFKDSSDAAESSRRFHCELGDFMEGAAFALSSSMFSSTKLCILYNIDAISSEASGEHENTKGKKNKVGDIFNELVSDLPDDTYLVVTTSKPQPPKVISASSLKKFEVIQFWRHFDSDMSNYIKSNLAKHGLSLEDGALNMILERTGKDIRKADAAIEILINAQSTDISRELVLSVISDEAEISVFNFSDALFQRDKRAIAYYKKLIDAGLSESRIFSEIMRQTALLEKYYSLTDKLDSISGTLEACGIAQKFQDKFLSFTRAFSKEQVTSLYKELMRTDYKRKNSRKSKSILSDPILLLINDIVFNDTLQ